MKIKLGLRGSSDAVYGIIVKFDDLSLVSSDNIFLIGEENRNKMGDGKRSIKKGCRLTTTTIAE